MSMFDCDYNEFLASSREAIRNGRTMKDAFQRMCSDIQPHATLDLMNHTARHARNTILNCYNRLVRKAKQKGIID